MQLSNTKRDGGTLQEMHGAQDYLPTWEKGERKMVLEFPVATMQSLRICLGLHLAGSRKLRRDLR